MRSTSFIRDDHLLDRPSPEGGTPGEPRNSGGSLKPVQGRMSVHPEAPKSRGPLYGGGPKPKLGPLGYPP